MKKLFAFLDKMMEWICFLSIAVFTILIFGQVICRYVLKTPLLWQEEVCLYLFYIVVLAGAIQAIRNYAHISVDFINQRLPERGRLVLRVVVYFLILVCCVFITYSGYLYCTSVGSRRSGELRILMKYVYALFPISGVFMCVYTIRGIIDSGTKLLGKGGR